MKAGILDLLGYAEYKIFQWRPKKRKSKSEHFHGDYKVLDCRGPSDRRSGSMMWGGSLDLPRKFRGQGGRLNPGSPNGSTQYGMRVVWEIRSGGSYLNEGKDQ